jgi:hypothetical protein
VAVACPSLTSAPRRAVLSAPVSVTMVCSTIDIVATSLLLWNLIRHQSSETLTFKFMIGLVSIAGCDFILAVVVLACVCIDPHGKTVYDAELAWCAPGLVSRFVTYSSLAVSAVAGLVLYLNLAFYLANIKGGVMYPELKSVPSIEWAPLGIVVDSSSVALLALIGAVGGKFHVLWPLLVYTIGSMLFLLLQAAFAMLLIFETGHVRVQIAENSTAPGPGHERIEPPNPQALDVLENLSVISQVSFILTCLQVTTVFFCAIVLKTDATSVHKADYL